MDFIKQHNKAKLKLQEITLKLQQGDILKNPQALPKLIQEKNNLEELVKDFENLARINQELESIKNLIKESDEEFQKIAEEEEKILKKQKKGLEDKIKMALLPQDPADSKNAIVEIRAGVGGEESALFAAEIFKMYSKYAQKNNFKVNVTSVSKTSLGGFKNITFEVAGREAYAKFKYESGIHRVQRIPKTESGGRIHTSAVSVAVLPEASEVEVEIKPEEIKIETFKSSGPGGQHAQKTESAVRITHLKTGISASCEESRSQLKNKEKALSILRAKLYQLKRDEEEKKRKHLRRIQIGTGDRSEKIRTYNFPQNRVTDHRISYTLNNLEQILEGNLEELINKLNEENQKKKLEKIK